VCEQQPGGGGVLMDLISPAMRDYSAFILIPDRRRPGLRLSGGRARAGRENVCAESKASAAAAALRYRRRLVVAET